MPPTPPPRQSLRHSTGLDSNASLTSFAFDQEYSTNAYHQSAYSQQPLTQRQRHTLNTRSSGSPGDHTYPSFNSYCFSPGHPHHSHSCCHQTPLEESAVDCGCWSNTDQGYIRDRHVAVRSSGGVLERAEMRRARTPDIDPAPNPALGFADCPLRSLCSGSSVHEERLRLSSMSAAQDTRRVDMTASMRPYAGNTRLQSLHEYWPSTFSAAPPVHQHMHSRLATAPGMNEQFHASQLSQGSSRRNQAALISKPLGGNGRWDRGRTAPGHRYTESLNDMRRWNYYNEPHHRRIEEELPEESRDGCWSSRQQEPLSTIARGCEERQHRRHSSLNLPENGEHVSSKVTGGASWTYLRSGIVDSQALLRDEETLYMSQGSPSSTSAMHKRATEQNGLMLEKPEDSKHSSRDICGAGSHCSPCVNEEQAAISTNTGTSTVLAESRNHTSQSSNAYSAEATSTLPKDVRVLSASTERPLQSLRKVEIASNATSCSRFKNEGASDTRKNGSDLPMTQAIAMLECPVCCDDMSDVIWQCPEGHVICKYCRNRLAACPTCRNSCLNIRCRALESLAESLGNVTCRYTSGGCTAVMSYKERRAHQDHCPHKPFPCIEGCGAHPEDGSTGLVEHLVSKHDYIVINSNMIRSVIRRDAAKPVCTSVEGKTALLWQKQIFYCFGRHHLLRAHYLPGKRKGGIFLFSVTALASLHHVGSYRLQVTSSRRRFTFEGPLWSIRKGIANLEKVKDCLMLCENLALFLSGGTGAETDMQSLHLVLEGEIEA